MSLLQAKPVNDPLLVIPAIYDDVHPFSDGVAEVQRDGKWETIDRNGRQVLPHKQDRRQNNPGGIQKSSRKPDTVTFKTFTINKKIGIKDKNGKVLIPPILAYVGDGGGSEGMIPVGTEKGPETFGYGGGKWGFINTNGKLVIPLQYFAVNVFHHGLASIIIGDGRIYFGSPIGHWVPIDKQGKLVIGTKYDGCRYLTDNLLAICTGAQKDRYGYPRSVRDRYPDTERYVGAKWGVINYHTRKIEVPLKYDDIFKLTDKLLTVCVGEKYCPPNEPPPNCAPDGTDIGTINTPGKWGIIDYNGKIVMPLKYQNIREISPGMLAVQLNDKWGIINYQTMKLVVPITYDRINRLSDKFIAVCIGEKYSPTKDPLPDNPLVSNDFRTNTHADRWGVIDQHHKTILPINYQGMGRLSQDMLAVKLNGKWGFTKLK